MREIGELRLGGNLNEIGILNEGGQLLRFKFNADIIYEVMINYRK